MALRVLSRWRFWTLSALGAIALGLTVANMFLFSATRSLQGEVNARQQYIQQSVQLEVLNRELINALAALAVRRQDEQIRGLLAAHGIAITLSPPAAAPAPAGEATRPAPGAAPTR